MALRIVLLAASLLAFLTTGHTWLVTARAKDSELADAGATEQDAGEHAPDRDVDAGPSAGHSGSGGGPSAGSGARPATGVEALDLPDQGCSATGPQRATGLSSMGMVILAGLVLHLRRRCQLR